MKKLESVVRVLFAAMLAYVMVILAFFAGDAYHNKKAFLLGNATLIPMALGAVAVMAVALSLRRGGRSGSDTRRDRLALALALTLLAAQVYVGYCILFKTGWDPWSLVDTARTIAGYGPGANVAYFSRYPNNLPLLTLYAMLFRLNATLHLFAEPYDLMCVVIVNALANALTCYLVYRIVRWLSGSGWGLAAFALAVLLVGTSPWTVICYADAFALVFPTLAFWLYTLRTHTRRGTALKLLAILLCGFAGYLFKPYTLIAPASLLLASACGAIRRDPKRVAAVLAAALAAALCFAGFCAVEERGMAYVARYALGFEPDREAAFGWQHFLLVGMNANSQGAYAQEDVDYSASFDTRAERNRGDLRYALERLGRMGLGGWMAHLKSKTLITFNDGTFAWGREGNFYLEVYETPKLPGAGLFREILYEDGRCAPIAETLRQFAWLATLALALLSALARREGQRGGALTALWLSILGFGLYEALFEVRARYLYTYAPCFIILAVLGLEACSTGLRGLWKGRQAGPD